MPQNRILNFEILALNYDGLRIVSWINYLKRVIQDSINLSNVFSYALLIACRGISSINAIERFFEFIRYIHEVLF